MSDRAPRQTLRSALARPLLLLAGLLSTALAAVGVFLPLLPTTPFLLVAAACFLRSSPELHRRLLANRLFGPTITQWQRERTVPREAKWKACGLVVVTFAVSIAVVDVPWLRGALVCLGLGLLALLARLPTRTREAELVLAPEEARLRPPDGP